MTLTLEAIKAEHSKIGDMIASFERRAQFEARFPITVPAPMLLPGEKFACTVIEPNGTKYHLTLLPGDNDGIDHDGQLKWAAQQGGDLPDLTEQALLRKYLPDEFQKCAYWSKERHKTERGYAWCTGFRYGGQGCSHQDGKLRGRAVRRLVFE